MYKIELDERRKPGGQVGTLQAICVQRTRLRLERKGGPANWSARFRQSTYKIELSEKKKPDEQTGVPQMVRG